MYKTFLLFSVLLLQIYIHPPIMSEETKISKRDVWRHLNRFDPQAYEKWHNEYVLSKRNSGHHEPGSIQYAEVMAEYLQLPKEIENSVCVDIISIQSKDIQGYLECNSDMAFAIGRPGYGLPTRHITGFAVDTEQWSENLAQIGPGRICAYVGCCNTYEEARNSLIQMVTSGNKMPQEYLTLYKIEKGPGDVCLVHMDGSLLTIRAALGQPTTPRLSDHRVAFIRGNVAVYLCSYYKDFGCMDLAYRLDALLVEQFEKAQKMQEQKAETASPFLNHRQM